MKKAIVYKSRLGSTEKYAQWLKEEIGADLFKHSQLKGKKLNDYDLVVVMSGTYAGMMPLIGYLKKNWQYLENKKVIVVAVGAAPEDDEVSKKSYLKIPEYIREKIKYFKKIRGRMVGEKEDLVKKENLEAVIKKINSLIS